MRTVAVFAVLAAVTVEVAPRWAGQIAYMTTVASPPELAEATHWVADNVPRDQVLVVHDAIWTDLVHQYGFAKDDVIIYGVSGDACIRRMDKGLLPLETWFNKVTSYKWATDAQCKAAGVINLVL